jgi:hypothetical protein
MRVEGSASSHHTNHIETVPKHVIDEVVSHFIWDKIGTLTGIGHFAAGVLGNLLTFQQLGGGDEFLIPNRISPEQINSRAVLSLEMGRNSLVKRFSIFIRDSSL